MRAVAGAAGAGLALIGVALAAAACNGAAAPPTAAPACTCVCPPAPPPSPCAPGPASPAAAGGDVGELVASANRKMLHDDGAGCLADLDLVAKADPRLAERLTATRAQCDMLVGRCQEGKRRLAAYYRDETNLSQERADAVAEQIASMRCRGGDSTPRDELLRALFELSDGAYVNRRDPAFCRDRVATVRRLAPLVTPAGPEDTQIEGGKKALFHTAASCFAKAGDCAGAFAAYRDSFPQDGLSAIKDPAVRESTVKQSFRSSISACKDMP